MDKEDPRNIGSHDSQVLFEKLNRKMMQLAEISVMSATGQA